MNPVKTRTKVMPISGSKIVNHIGASVLLARCGYVPDIILASSGGCITAIMEIAADIASVECFGSCESFEAKLKYLTKHFSTKNYCKPWCSIAPLNTCLALGRGSLFDTGTGADFIDPDTVDFSGQPELWIGTTEYATKKSQLFCTKTRQEARLQFDGAIYLAENVPEILDATTASSAIQTIVPCINIRGKHYQDGGHSRASPLGPFIEAHQEHNISYHVVYISPVRYNKNDDPHERELEDDDIWNRLRAGTGKMLTDWHVPDRNNGVRMVHEAAAERGGRVYKQKGIGIEALKEFLNIQEEAYASFIEIAPLKACCVRFLFMQKGDMYKGVCESLENGYSIRHWYVM